MSPPVYFGCFLDVSFFFLLIYCYLFIEKKKGMKSTIIKWEKWSV